MTSANESSGAGADLVTRLVPILRVKDADAERTFYELFGLRTTYEGSEYPGFIAVGNDAVEFGLESRADSDPGDQANLHPQELTLRLRTGSHEGEMLAGDRVVQLPTRTHGSVRWPCGLVDRIRLVPSPR